MDYAKLIEDSNNGTINREDWLFKVDNDNGYWSYIGEELDDEAYDEALCDIENRYGNCDGYRDMVDVLQAAGVHCNWE